MQVCYNKIYNLRFHYGDTDNPISWCAICIIDDNIIMIFLKADVIEYVTRFAKLSIKNMYEKQHFPLFSLDFGVKCTLNMNVRL